MNPPTSTTPTWKVGVFALLAIIIAAGYIDRCDRLILDDLGATGKSLVVAVETFNAKNGRYPMSLDELVPKYLPELPKAGKYFVIDYAVEPGGKQCWLSYQVHRDRLEEYNCRKRGWQNVEIEDSETYMQPNLKRQRIESEMWLAARRAREGAAQVNEKASYESVLPTDAKNVTKTPLGQLEQVSFAAQRKYPAFAFTDERIAALVVDGWKRCKSSAEDWSSFVEAASGSRVRVHQKILHFRKSDQVLMLVGRYVSPAPNTIEPGEALPDSETQNGAVVVMKGSHSEMEEALKTFNAQC